MMNNSNNNAPVARREVATVLPVRRAPSVVEAQRPSFRVLQSGRAPAQLSLFLRPANAR
jgi:hypothetical protein